ncbi:error-prone repair protein UmuD [Chromobacterium violaceum]|uniref:LexA family protein n=1 Tax=Chromobacterium violaceum TaxID=536 RepID=UPI000653B21D|nr:translesion error-prone DNA polymerase V autoproteolytic subunit [Chromobacterium violaceum]KMN49750.1 error-prone repair protein UmuD [Chromobacterium violaceum]KMN87892.1 error-prone repair protein UmuD [Chromobacterium violaceum]KMN88476.1 error-prone repair protein UmuD [Chromobacterium violaceum]KMO05495.1 error-prone repair protein UmuD [Chromobacterium violaceum]
MSPIPYLIPQPGGQPLPLVLSPVQAGFPSPADDYLDDNINLHDYLVTDPPATFIVRVRGDSMIGAGIDNGDLLVVDKGLTANHGDIVIAVLDGEFTVKRLHRMRGRCALIAENPAYPPIRLADGQELEIWGVVRGCVKRFR